MTAAHDASHPLTDGLANQRLLKRLTVATGGGMFIDGFIFASIASALANKAMTNGLHVTSLWSSFISSSTLVGIFFGGLLFGYVTDRVGRRPMFTIDLSVFMVCAALMFFVAAPWQIFTLAFVMGLAVGADYSIGSPLLAEFAPSHKRGNYLGVLEILWNVGYVIAYAIGYLINTNWPGAWHVTLAASLVPALICLLVRHGLPESPRWLLSKGRRADAAAILRSHMEVPEDYEDFAVEREERTNYGEIFSPAYRLRTIFCATFWIATVLPYFALTFFQPDVLRAIGLGKSALAGALLGTCIALIGAGIGWYLVDRVGRRKVLIPPFFFCGAFLLLVSIKSVLPVWLTAMCFFGYLFSYGINSIMSGIYPDELFPTSIRTSAVGFASAASRVGAAFGTFLLPICLHHLGLGFVMVFLGVVSLIGGFTSYYWAPETARRTLSETSDRANQRAVRPTRSAPAGMV